jgi:hypothetical protein
MWFVCVHGNVNVIMNDAICERDSKEVYALHHHSEHMASV